MPPNDKREFPSYLLAMRWPLLLSLFLALPVRAEDATVSDYSTLDGAMRAYTPAWQPEKNEIPGLIVVIDPARSGEPPQRRADEVALMTGEHLYHLIRYGGGTGMMTRADDQPVPGSSAGLRSALAEQVACLKGHLLVRIECTGHGELEAGAAFSLDGAFAEGLAAQSLQARTLGGFKVPAAAVRLEPQAGETPVQDRLRHRVWAEQIYRGIAQFAAARRAAIDENRARAFGGALPESCSSVPVYPNQTPEQKRIAFARGIWSEGPLPADRVAWFCSMYARLRPSNRTLIYFEPKVERSGDRITLTGGTTDRQLATGLMQVLADLGVKAEDKMQLLPNETTLGPKLFGALRVSMARTFAQPSETGFPQTQALFGEALFLLDRAEGHYLAQTSDGYWGWLREEAVEPMTREQFAAYMRLQIGILTGEVIHGGLVLRPGTRLPVACGESGEACELSLPDGRTLKVPADKVRVIDSAVEAQTRVRGALELIFTPYVYGARSTIGLDCSGMVAYLSEITGLAPARDASQQALAGRLVGTRWYRDGIQTGDLLYFMDESGKIFHTGVALNTTHFIHASPPEVQISSLKPGDRLYNKHWDTTFFVAKRP